MRAGGAASIDCRFGSQGGRCQLFLCGLMCPPPKSFGRLRRIYIEKFFSNLVERIRTVVPEADTVTIGFGCPGYFD